MNEAYKYLLDFCQEQEDLTVSLLREKLEAGPADIVRGNLHPDIECNGTLLHGVCYNPRVTLGVVRYLVEIYPEAVRVQTEYCWLPLHRACNNAACPDDVIEYLVDLYPDALGVSWPPRGLPLHCLLGRQTSNRIDVKLGNATEEVLHELNLDIVKRLVEAYPEALTNQDNVSNHTPLFCACEREDLSMDLVRLLVDPDLSVIRLRGGYGESRDLPLEVLMDRNHSTNEKEWHAPFEVVRFFIESAPATITPSLMVEICRRRNVTLETVKIIVETRPDVSLLDQLSDGMLPLHSLCLNTKSKDDANTWLLPIIEYVVDLYPEAVKSRNHYGFLPISYAVSTTLEITRFLYEKHPDSFCHDRWGNTPLVSACSSGGIDTVIYLFDQGGADLLAGPLLHRSLKSDRDTQAKVDFILENDPKSIDRKDRASNLPLHAACSAYTADLSLIRRVFDLHPEAVAARNDKGRFPIHEFLSTDRWGTSSGAEIVEFLVAQFPASLKLADYDGMLPLHHACKNSYSVDIVIFLLGAYVEGIKVDSPKYGLPLHCAVTGFNDSNTRKIIDFLLSVYPEAIGVRNETVGTPLEVSECPDTFVTILRYRYSGKTHPHHCLHHALRDEAILNPTKVVQFFIENFGGNVKQIDNFGRHPLHVAASSPRAWQEVVKELLKVHPAAAMHQDKQGCIPLHLFFCNGASLVDSVQVGIFDKLAGIVDDSELFKMVESMHDGIFDEVEKKVAKMRESLKVMDRNGCLPLHYACRYGTDTRVLTKMLALHPDAVKVRDRNGCIPLHVACRRGVLSVEGVKLLVNCDNTTAQLADNDRELPLHKACRGGHLEIINYLLEQHAPASGMRNASGYLPIHTLCRKSGKAELSAMDTPEYTETLFRLLRAHPEAVVT